MDGQEESVLGNIREGIADIREGIADRHADALEHRPDPYFLIVAIGAAIVSAIVSEAINWYLIYRHQEYKDLTRLITDNSDKLDLEREKMAEKAGQVSTNQQKARMKKIQMAEAELRMQH